MAILHSLLLECAYSGPVPLVEKVILMALMVLHLGSEDLLTDETFKIVVDDEKAQD